jgi:molybdopterin-guanine dinucleotide biosynthesis protein A
VIGDSIAADLPRMHKITGVILAGGQGRRMGNVDKGLQAFRGQPMVASVLNRFAPQVDEVLINCNRNLELYERFGFTLIPDRIKGFAGPLAGLHAALTEAQHDLVATAPCDSPFLPLDLVSRLRSALDKNDAQLAVAKTFTQAHPVFSLSRKDLLPHLSRFLEQGGRKIDAWYAKLKVIEVSFDDAPHAFSNINTLEELGALERRD